MSEQQPAIGSRWGDSVPAQRQAELQAYLDRWSAETNHGTRQGPFDGAQLTGADVFWLAVESESGSRDIGLNLHLEGAILREAHLEGAILRQAHLDGANLSYAHLQEADLREVRLGRADLSHAHLERADLGVARLEGVILREAHLEGTNFLQAHLEGADLGQARLESANLHYAHLEGSGLNGAHLEGANLFGVRLDSADLRSAYFDKYSRLNDAVLSGALFDQVTFDGTNLTGVDWSLVRILGDERTARQPRDANRRLKTRARRLDEYKAAVRANRALAGILDSQGLSEDAARFGYRAEVLQRTVYFLERRLSTYLFSLLLAVLGGYGYRPFRLLYVYVAVLISYTFLYWQAPQIWHTALQQLSFSDAGLTSLQVVLGHGLPGGEAVPLSDPVNLIADSEVGVSVVYGLIFANAVGGRYFGR